MYDFSAAVSIFGALMSAVVISWLLYQWVYWIDNGHFWSLKSHQYKDWWVGEYRRKRLSLFILIFILSGAAGLLGYLR